MASIHDFFYGSEIAVWQEAIASVLDEAFADQDEILKGAFLGTGGLSDILDRFGFLLKTKTDGTWDVESFRESIQELIQAFLYYSGTKTGVQQAVSSVTQVSPVLRSVQDLPRWLLGYQYLKNPDLTLVDGLLVSSINDPYVFSADAILTFSILGQPTQRFTISAGTYTAQEIVDLLNVSLIGAIAYTYGHRFYIMVLDTTNTASIQVEKTSTADTILGLDRYVHTNTPIANVTGTVPLDWSLSAPNSSISEIRNPDASAFGRTAPAVSASNGSPYTGLITNTLLDNGGFENGFEGWDMSGAPDAVLDMQYVYEGSKSVAITTRIDDILGPVVNTLATFIKPVPEGSDLRVSAQYRISTSSVIYDAPTSSNVFTWRTSATVPGFVNGQESDIARTDDAPLLSMVDTGVDFVAQGVKPGMAIHAERDFTNIRHLVQAVDGVLYGAPTTGGLVISRDSGQNWELVSGIGLQVSIYRLTADPKDARTLYATTLDDGVYKTTNGGINWTFYSTGVAAGAALGAVVVNPLDTTIVYSISAINNKLYKSTDSGQTWTLSNTGLPAGGNLNVIAIDPSTPANLYVGHLSTDGVYKSTNSGGSWSAANTGLATSNAKTIISIAINPIAPSTLLIGTLDRVYKTTNSAGTWAQTGTSGISNPVVTAFAFDSSNSSIVYAANSDNNFPVTVGAVAKSLDGGSTWTNMSSGLPIAPLIWGIVSTTANSNVIVAGTSLGFFVTPTGGLFWEVSDTGLQVGTYNGKIVAVYPHELWIDAFLDDNKNAWSLAGSGSTVSYTTNTLVDSAQSASSAFGFPESVQTGADFSTRDKLRVIFQAHQFGELYTKQIIRDIVGVASDTITVDDWGGNQVPPPGTAYVVYTRPVNGSPYTIYRALTEIPGFTNIDGKISADIFFQISYFDSNKNPCGFDRVRPIFDGPIHADGTWRSCIFTKSVPPRTQYAQLSVIVQPDNIGTGAVVRIDDVQWEIVGDLPARDLHFSVDGMMQKLPIQDVTSEAAGVITLLNPPKDGEAIVLGKQIYEFDWGAHATGTITYVSGSDTSLNGKTLTVGNITYLFQAVPTTTPGSDAVVIKLTGSLDNTFKALVSDINMRSGSSVVATYRVVAPQITFTAVQEGVVGNSTNFSTNISTSVIQLGPGSATTATIFFDATQPVTIYDAAQITGTATTFAGIDGQTLNLQINNGPVITTIFQSSDTTATAIAARINGALDAVLAPATATTSSGHVRIYSTGSTLSVATITVVSGTALPTIGFTTGQTVTGAGIATQVRIGPKIFELDFDGIFDNSDPIPHVDVDISSAVDTNGVMAALVSAINGDGTVSTLVSATLTSGTSPLILTLQSGVDGSTLPFYSNQPKFTLTPTTGFVGIFSGGEVTPTVTVGHVPVSIPFQNTNRTTALDSLMTTVNITSTDVSAIVSTGLDGDSQCAIVAIKEGGEGNYTPFQSIFSLIPVPTTLSSNIAATDTSIPVVSTAGFPTIGGIAIASEYILYDNTNAVDTVHFFNATRGAFNSTAAGHSSGVTVSAPALALNPTGNYLIGGTSGYAIGVLTFLDSPPEDGDVVVVCSRTFEFDDDGYTTTGTIPITIQPTTAFTMQALVDAINQTGDVTAKIVSAADQESSLGGEIHLTSLIPGTAGNSLQFHSHSAVIVDRTADSVQFPNIVSTDSSGATGTGCTVKYPYFSIPVVTPVCSQTANNPTTTSVGTMTVAVPVGTKIVVCIADRGTSPAAAPVVTDSTSGTDFIANNYVQDAGVPGSWIYSSTLKTGLNVGDTITVSVPGGSTFGAVAWSALMVTNVTQNASGVAYGSGSTGGGGFTIVPSISPTGGEILFSNVGVLTANTSIFVCPAVTLIGKIGTPNSGTVITTNPGYALSSVETLRYAVNSPFADVDRIFASELATYINNAVTSGDIRGVVASSVIDDTAPNGRLVLTSTTSSYPAEMIIGNGTVNSILGFTDAAGRANRVPFDKSGWKLTWGTSGTMTLTSRARAAATKGFGSLWRARGWMTLKPSVQTTLNGSLTSGATSIVLTSAAGFPSTGTVVIENEAISYTGISVNTLTGCTRGQYGTTAVAHATLIPVYHSVVAQAAIRYDGGSYKTGSQVALTSTAQLVEAYVQDDGVFTTSDVQFVISGGIAGDIMTVSDVFLLSDINKSYHLTDNTIPRNKQRSNRMYRLTFDIPGTPTDTENGLLGQWETIDSETLSIPANGFAELANKNIFPESEEVLQTGGFASGIIYYSGQPENSSIVKVGIQTFQFGTSTNPLYINIPINVGGDDATWTDFVTSVNNLSTSVSAAIDITRNTVTLTALTAGTDGNKLPFTTSSSATLSPTTGKLAGGSTGTVFHRDTDYSIIPEDGKVFRISTGRIPDPSPKDLVISYSYNPADIASRDSYPQTIKPVGAKIELDHSCVTYSGNSGDFTAGVSQNFTPVVRTPDRFSYLSPAVRGAYAQVLTNYVGGTSFQLDYPADLTRDILVTRDGIPLENASTGWTLDVLGQTLTLATAEFSGASVYEIAYSPIFTYTSAGVKLAIPDFYILGGDSFKRVDPLLIDTEEDSVLRFDENLLAQLPISAVQDQALSELSRTFAGITEILPDSAWEYIDDRTIHIQPSEFSDVAIYSLTYRTSSITVVHPITEVLSYSTCNDNNSYPPFTPFASGDTVNLSQYVKFRVMISGDFRIQDYRFKGFSAFLKNAGLISFGYGITPYGIFAYGDPPGDCGFTESSNLPGGDQTPSGNVTLTGTVVTTVL